MATGLKATTLGGIDGWPKISRYRKKARPELSSVTPMPETCWLSPNVTVSNPISMPDTTPAAIAATTPSHKLPLK